MNYNCPHCAFVIEVEYPKRIHAGYSNLGFMYCNSCGDILTWSSFDSKYTKIVGQKHPWMLTEEEKKKVESSVVECHCGSKFTFSAMPRCPICNNEIPDIVSDKIHFVVLGNRVNGEEEKTDIWKES